MTKTATKRDVVSTVEVGESITVPPMGDGFEVQAACPEKSAGIWFCVTHQHKCANQWEKDSHIKRGKHRLAWLCFAHGPEKP